jgi:hypothetical protein
MDGAIAKMNSIIKEYNRRNESEKLTREELLDYQQEVYRQYAILAHVGRAYKNPAGRITGLAVGTVGGILFGSSKIAANAKGWKVNGILSCYALAGGVIGYLAFSSHFGNRYEYSVYKKKKAIADEAYEKFHLSVNQ